ncbi:Crp/Fnr family transcriptional regulator [Salisediminibacterium beveridgei]|uniref:Transcriptional regulator, Crp/Fnr family n=1 Tax=Salisediminibacterium beveridgei TaxID=632773 RepID=A0A1D7QUS6_9BACI|nr:Crp/Fnr family transcriptional regulator [Salisediminibacterium beveridgei]AOM82770.1 transcriptional regulator, Crp/Fnr family [Salisediminibacterium beveridgei]
MNWKYYLKKSVWFGGLNESEQEELIDLGKDIQYRDKERLFLEGNPKRDLFVLGEGTVLISKLTETGNESVINVLSEGEIFPHAGLFDHTEYPGTATAKKDVRVLALPIDQIEAFILARPEVSIKIIQMMNQNMLMLQRKLNELLSMDVHARLQSAIDHLTRVQGNEIILTHQELGHLIGSTRETVSRQLKKWEVAGYLTIKKDRIIIHSSWEERA